MGRPANCHKQRTMHDAQREALIVERRAHSVPFRAIADEVGLSVTRTHEIFNEACARVPAAAVHSLRVQLSELADRGIADLLKIAESGRVSDRSRVEAWRAVLAWSESLRKLYGADAPSRREITVITDDVVDAALRAASEEFEAGVRVLEGLEARAAAGLGVLGG